MKVLELPDSAIYQTSTHEVHHSITPEHALIIDARRSLKPLPHWAVVEGPSAEHCHVIALHALQCCCHVSTVCAPCRCANLSDTHTNSSPLVP